LRGISSEQGRGRRPAQALQLETNDHLGSRSSSELSSLPKGRHSHSGRRGHPAVCGGSVHVARLQPGALHGRSRLPAPTCRRFPDTAFRPEHPAPRWSQSLEAGGAGNHAQPGSRRGHVRAGEGRPGLGSSQVLPSRDDPFPYRSPDTRGSTGRTFLTSPASGRRVHPDAASRWVNVMVGGRRCEAGNA